MKTTLHKGVQMFLIPTGRSATIDSTTHAITSTADMDVDATAHSTLRDVQTAASNGSDVASLLGPTSSVSPMLGPSSSMSPTLALCAPGSALDGDYEKLSELGLLVRKGENIGKIGLQQLDTLEKFGQDCLCELSMTPLLSEVVCCVNVL